MHYKLRIKQYISLTRIRAAPVNIWSLEGRKHFAIFNINGSHCKKGSFKYSHTKIFHNHTHIIPQNQKNYKEWNIDHQHTQTTNQN